MTDKSNLQKLTEQLENNALPPNVAAATRSLMALATTSVSGTFTAQDAAPRVIDRLVDQLAAVLIEVVREGADRALALAVTKVEEAILWLRNYFETD